MNNKEQKNITLENFKSIFEGKNKLYVFTVICIVALALGLFALPIGYYSLLRWFICGTAIFIAIKLNNKEKTSFTFWSYCLVALVYNPIAPLHLGKDFWSIVNIATILGFIYIIKEHKDFFIINKTENK